MLSNECDAGCLPVNQSQSTWLALHLQITVTDWPPLRSGGFTTSILYDAIISRVNV
ncbi:hypothetical protein BN1200_440002 [Klebsiella variicola]|nr:hypothetical protein BN1200_440002 [Klebsiella variicola]